MNNPNEKDPTIFEAMQAFDSLTGAVVFTSNEIALFYAILSSWNAAHRPSVLQQWATTTCSKSGLNEKHTLPNARNGLVQKKVLFFNKNGSRGVPNYSLNALLGLPMPPSLLPKNGSKRGSKDGTKSGSKGGVKAGVKAGSYEEKEKEKESPLTPKGEWDGVFPKGSLQRSKIEQKKTRTLKSNEKMKYVGAWFGRKPESLWSVHEASALRELNPSKEEVLEMKRYRSTPNEFHRRDLITLLINWNGELDRARALQSSPSSGAESHELEGPEGWKEAYKELFEGLNPPLRWIVVDFAWREQILNHLKGGSA